MANSSCRQASPIAAHGLNLLAQELFDDAPGIGPEELGQAGRILRSSSGQVLSRNRRDVHLTVEDEALIHRPDLDVALFVVNFDRVLHRFCSPNAMDQRTFRAARPETFRWIQLLADPRLQRLRAHSRQHSWARSAQYCRSK